MRTLERVRYELDQARAQYSHAQTMTQQSIAINRCERLFAEEQAILSQAKGTNMHIAILIVLVVIGLNILEKMDS